MLGRVQLFETPWTSLPGFSVHADSPSKNTGVSCPGVILLQGIFPTQQLHPGLLHCRWILHCVNHHRIPFNSSVQLCLILCNPMDCSTPGFPVHHQLLDPTQTQVHCIGDAIQPSPSIRVFSNESVLRIMWPFSSYILLKENGTQERAGLEEEGRVRDRQDRHLQGQTEESPAWWSWLRSARVQ